MKITPSNQTLILAGERRGSGAPSVNSPGKPAASATAAGSVLQRLTIVAARPDTTVLYLQADYSAGTDAPRPASRDTGGRLTSSGAATPGTALAVRRASSAPRDAYGNSYSSSIGTQGISSYLNPVEQYAQTQRILGVASRVPQIDVHA